MGRRAFVFSLCILFPSTVAGQGHTVLLLADDASGSGLREALAVELAARGSALEVAGSPAGTTQLARSASAQQAARERGARAAVWVEQVAGPAGVTWQLRVVGAGDSENVRQAPLPSPFDARTLALVAASLLEELIPRPSEPELIVEAESEGPVTLRVRMRGSEEPERDEPEPAAPPSSAASEAAPIPGTILQRNGREIVIAGGGKLRGVRRSHVVELTTGPEDDARVVSFASVIEVGKRIFARVPLGGYPIEDARFARPSDMRTVLLRGRVRQEGFSIAAVTRGAVVWGASAEPGGALELRLAYHVPQVPLAFSAELAPLAGAYGGGVLRSAYGALFSAGLDFDFGAVALEAGLASVNTPLADSYALPQSGPRFVIGLSGRVGFRDGWNLSARLTIAATEEIPIGDGVTLGNADLSFQFPLIDGVWLVGAGGVGTAGFMHAELGPRFLVAGELGSGSVLLRVTAGFFALGFHETCGFSGCEPLEFLIGPSLGIGVEVRP